MAITAPVASTPLPTPPSTASPVTFDARADAFLAAMTVFQTEENALATTNYNNAMDCQTNAGIAQSASASAASSAASALAASGAAAWVSGATYIVGAAAYSPVNRLIYRCILGTSGTTDPSADGTHWVTTDTELPVVVVTGTSYTMTFPAHLVLTNAVPTAITPMANPQAGDRMYITVANGSISNVVYANTKTIMGQSSYMVLDILNVTAKFRYVNNDWKLL